MLAPQSKSIICLAVVIKCGRALIVCLKQEDSILLSQLKVTTIYCRLYEHSIFNAFNRFNNYLSRSRFFPLSDKIHFLQTDALEILYLLYNAFFNNSVAVNMYSYTILGTYQCHRIHVYITILAND